ncbi:transcriptional regulator [Gracilibacillus halophilus YIM-C55.5]|uniref:HTH-type transcriptional regulator n=1 Tax=Gracilibacillus halophilus YIM-C55.5 TaxID=1308866 RepID=N4WMS6_9BACI|nr:GbsR/MarR family transcriptional regulator [Gracilibacillus halophilus]ENH95820.1 transcriptional regulator [Gracilibacillus halophilus YIM-C55.5]
MDSRHELEHEKMESAKDKVIGAISETMDLYGLTRSAGKLYATMYFEDEMTLDEMRQELSMSKPSMSTSVRKLQEIEMVKKVFRRGSRKDVYVAEKNFFRSFMVFYCQMWDREVKMNMEAIHQAQKELSELIEDTNTSKETRQEAQEHYDLLERSKTYYLWLEKLVASIRNEEIFEFLPKPDQNELNHKNS